MPIRGRRCCLRVVQHDLGLTRHVGQAIEASSSRSSGGGQGHIPGPLLGEPDPGVRDREGVGRLGPGQLCAQTSGLRRRLLLQNFRLLLLHVGVWLTLPFFGFPRLPVSISSCLRWSASALLPFRSEAGLIYTSVYCFVIECYKISTLPQ
jgi:hypothetical protein